MTEKSKLSKVLVFFSGSRLIFSKVWIVVSTFFRSGKQKRMMSALKVLLVDCLLVAIGGMALMFFGATPITRCFIDDAVTVEYERNFLRIVCLACPTTALNFLAITIFQATGKKVQLLILSLLRKGGLDIPLMFLFNGIVGINGIAWATPLADVLALVVSLFLTVPYLNHNNPASTQVTARLGMIGVFFVSVYPKAKTVVRPALGRTTFLHFGITKISTSVELIFHPEFQSHGKQAQSCISQSRGNTSGVQRLPEDSGIVDHIRATQNHPHGSQRHAGEQSDDEGPVPVIEAVDRESSASPEEASPAAHGVGFQRQCLDHPSYQHGENPQAVKKSLPEISLSHSPANATLGKVDAPGFPLDPWNQPQENGQAKAQQWTDFSKQVHHLVAGGNGKQTT